MFGNSQTMGGDIAVTADLSYSHLEDRCHVAFVIDQLKHRPRTFVLFHHAPGSIIPAPVVLSQLVETPMCKVVSAKWVT